MDKDLAKAIRTVILVVAVITALSAWMAFVEKPTKRKFKRAVRGTLPLL